MLKQVKRQLCLTILKYIDKYPKTIKTEASKHIIVDSKTIIAKIVAIRLIEPIKKPTKEFLAKSDH